MKQTEEKNQSQDQASDDSREAVDDRMQKIEEYLGALRRELDNIIPPVREFIVKHPIGSISAILGIGVTVGYLLGGNHKKKGSNRRRG